MSYGNLTFTKDVQQQRVKRLTRAGFVQEHFYTDQGAPFILGPERAYWHPIYDIPRRMLVVMSSRQAEKSTFASKNLLTDAFMFENDSILYATALDDHVRTFNSQKIKKQFDLNLQLQSDYLGPGSINNVHHKQYSNGSEVFLRAVGNSPDNARGITARKIYFDELQSIEESSIPIVKEVTQSFPDTSAYVYTFTPLTPQNHASRLYEDSMQFEWIITCPHCYRKNPPLGKEHIDEAKPFLFCIHCGKEMDAQRGQWIAQNPDGDYYGFRISRLMTPTCRWETEARDGVLDKLRDPNYAEYQFVNEVLGLPEGAGILVATEDQLRALEDADIDWIDPQNPPGWVHSRRVIGTIDWAYTIADGGQSYTIFALWVIDHGKIRCLYAKRQIGAQYANPDESIREMVEVFTRCNATLVGTDYGVGHKENGRLRKRLPRGRVFEFMYSGSSQTPQRRVDDNRPEGWYSIGRTETLDVTFSRIAAQQYLFPPWEKSKTFLRDVLNVYSEYDPNWKRRKYEHAGTGPDDFLHLMNYAQLVFARLELISPE